MSYRADKGTASRRHETSARELPWTCKLFTINSKHGWTKTKRENDICSIFVLCVVVLNINVVIKALGCFLVVTFSYLLDSCLMFTQSSVM